MKRIVIVGGGFSGTMTAVNLARFSAVPLQITVINKISTPCRGIAYSTSNQGHLLNVVARNMSALADQPNHFVEWLATRSEYVEQPISALRDLFAPRKIYGDYLHSLFHWHAKTAAPEKGIQLEMLSGDVNDISLADSQAIISLTDGRTLEADKVVLAIGNQTPAALRLRGLNPQSPKYINNPWRGWEQRLPAKDSNVLLIGTGLTTLDVFVTLQDLGWRGKIYATSRHGLLPLSHFQGQDYPDMPTDNLTNISLRKMFALFKQHYRMARARNINTAILVDKLRPFTQRLWQNFSLAEKKRFNRHLRARWNPTRHRIAPTLHRQLSDAIARSQVEIIKGRISECAESETAVRVAIESGGHQRVIEAGVIINCTGPRESYAAGESPLIDHLLARGLAQADEMNMGIRITPNFSVVNRNGASQDTLFAIGAILKGTLWESLAVPELRSQAFRVAEIISGQLAPEQAKQVKITESLEEVIEYLI